MKQNVALSILTPFSSKSAKKWGAAQKTELDEGGLLCYVPFFTSVMYVFQAEESILNGFEKIGHFIFPNWMLFDVIHVGEYPGGATHI